MTILNLIIIRRVQTRIFVSMSHRLEIARIPFFRAKEGNKVGHTIFPIKNPPSLRFLFSRLRTSARERQEEVPEKGSLRTVGCGRGGGPGVGRADGKIYSSQLPVEINKSHATRSRCAPTTAAIRVQGRAYLFDIIALLFAPGGKTSRHRRRRRECSTGAHQDIHEIVMKRSAIRCNRVPATYYCSYSEEPASFSSLPRRKYFSCSPACFRVPPPPLLPHAT